MSIFGKKSAPWRIKKPADLLWPLTLLALAVFYLFFFQFLQFFAYYFPVEQDYLLLLIGFISAAPFVFAVNYVFFSIVSRGFSKHLPNDKSRVRAILAIMSLPILTSLYGVLSYGLSSNLGDWINLLCVLAVPAFAALVAFGLVRFRKKAPIFHPEASGAFLVLCGVLLLLSIIESNYQGGYSAQITSAWDIFDRIFFPLQAIRYMIFGISVQVFAYIASFDLYVTPSSPETDLVFAIFSFLSFLLIGGLIIFWARDRKALSTRRWQEAGGILIIMIGVCSFLPFTRIQEAEGTWQVPAYHISKNIEKEEMGLFYHVQKQLSQQNLLYPHVYTACAQKDTLTFKQHNFGSVFTINVSDLSPTGVPNIRPEMSLINDRSFCNAISVTSKAPGQFACVERNVATPITDSSHDHSCEKILYRGQEVFNSLKPAYFKFALSENQEWVIISIGSVGRTWSEDLYLVDLRGIK